MNPKTFMLIAGEASGDLLAAELVSALREQVLSSTTDLPPSPTFIGAGGPKMKAAGVHLAFDLTQHSVIGLSDVLKNYTNFRRLFKQLLKLAIGRQPDAIIGVDYGGFNLRFGHAVKQYVRRHPGGWNPKIIQFVSPQVWASRPGRAKRLARDYDLLLSIFPFEKDWYAQRVPKLRVEFVGHPIIGRFTIADLRLTPGNVGLGSIANRQPQILLLPGSREGELRRHLPVMLRALELIQSKSPEVQAKMVLPNDTLKQLADKLSALPGKVEIQIGNLPQALMQAEVAIASTGTVTMECAFFGVPTVTLYKTSWLTYQVAKRIVTVKSLTMPNLLAEEEVFPEFVQGAATPGNIAGAALDLLQNEPRRTQIKIWLAAIVSTLGGPGASKRAASAILSLFT
ncbi:MAG: lipid-A-disaccharide synthase [Verrucomicrobiia bacterium]